jgi:hypothetical protein
MFLHGFWFLVLHYAKAVVVQLEEIAARRSVVSVFVRADELHQLKRNTLLAI